MDEGTKVPEPGAILVAVDFSEGAAGAVREGRRLARRLGAPLELLHVAERAAWEPDGAVAAWLSHVHECNATLRLRHGIAWAQIVRDALERPPLMVVVGSHGRRGFQSLAPGSTTSLLLTRCPVPVLVAVAGPAAPPSPDPSVSSFPRPNGGHPSRP